MTDPAPCDDALCPVCVCRDIERARPSRENILRAVEYAMLTIPDYRLTAYGIGDPHFPLFRRFTLPANPEPPA